VTGNARLPTMTGAMADWPTRIINVTGILAYSCLLRCVCVCVCMCIYECVCLYVIQACAHLYRLSEPGKRAGIGKCISMYNDLTEESPELPCEGLKEMAVNDVYAYAFCQAGVSVAIGPVSKETAYITPILWLIRIKTSNLKSYALDQFTFLK